MADALNSSTEAAAERADIPRSTVRYWLDQPEFASLRHETRENVADQFWAAIQVGLKEVANGLRDPETALRDKSVALGILYDKHALLTGGATNRSESRDITGTLADSDIANAIRAAEHLVATGQGRAETPPEGAAEG